MRSLRILPLLILPACAARPAATVDFDDFWAQFTTAVAADDVVALGRLTRYPFLFEGVPRDSTGFDVIHASLFDAGSRACLAAATPLSEDDRFAAFCGPRVYIFAQDERGWHFAEFTADPEAGEETAHGSGAEVVLGRWTFVAGRTAPWAAHGVDRAATGLAGTTLVIGTSHVQAAAPLGCAGGDVAFVMMPAQGLFQGGLPEPATAAALSLGIQHARTLTMQVTCDAGVFDYHQLPGDTLLFALDNVVWTLAPDADPTPADAVRGLLAQHMAGDMYFTPDGVAPMRHRLSATLASAIDTYFTGLASDEPPPINGDPFTDSQEYPDRFAFLAIETLDRHATVRIAFSWIARIRRVEFLLARQDGGWMLDDIRYEDGSTLRQLLR